MAAAAAAAAAQMTADTATAQIAALTAALQQQQQQHQQAMTLMQQQLAAMQPQPAPAAAAVAVAPIAAPAALEYYALMVREQKKTNATKPIPFKGIVEASATTAHTFILQMNNYFEQAGIITDDDKLKEVMGFVTAEAAIWWESEKRKPIADASKITTWAAFVTTFNARFITRDMSQIARENLYKLMRANNTNATEYTAKFIQNMEMIPNMATEDQIASYKFGLPIKMREKVQNKTQFKTLNEYTSYVYQQDATYKDLHHNDSASSTPSSATLFQRNRRQWAGGFNKGQQQQTQINQTDTEQQLPEGADNGLVAMQQSMEAMLKVMQQNIESRRGTGGGKGNTGGNQPHFFPSSSSSLNPGKVPGLSNEMAYARRDSGVCIKCNKKGHFKPQCRDAANITDWPEGYNSSGQKK
jgi:hypothetical protein